MHCLDDFVVGSILGAELDVRMGGKRLRMGHDSKVVSKVIESYIVEQLVEYCTQRGLRFRLNDVQNKYPDFIVITDSGPVAVDIKTSYLRENGCVNGFTLGTYLGYFRNRDSTKNTVLPYSEFTSHLCICVVYERGESICVKHCFIRPKWSIASRSTGSGNTTNIGSIKSLAMLLEGKTVFLSEHEFDQFWTTK